MRTFFLALGLVCLSLSLHGQQRIDTLRGEVTFVTSQHVYVKFPSTTGIKPGDTLYVQTDLATWPAIVVKNTSSTSCVGSPIQDILPEKGAMIYAFYTRIEEQTRGDEKETGTDIPIMPEEMVQEEEESTTPNYKRKEVTKSTTPIKGKLLAAAYLHKTDRPESDRQRMRYTLSFQANRIGHSGFSIESYASFRHTLKEWQEVKDDFFRAFKIYNLAVQYETSAGTRFWLGRKINPSTSNIGAIDGLQAEHAWRRFTLGAFAGSRPDNQNYGFNINLKQFGAYASHRKETPNGMMMTSLALAEQQRHQMTDRRFGYFQHINSSIKRIHLFTSFEFDLYTVEQNKPKSTFNLSSIYFSIRYRVSPKLSLFGSYDARKNIIYYETYKNFIDQLLEEETRQGFRFNVHYRPAKRISIGSHAGYRFQKGQPQPSLNMNNYVTVSNIPGLHLSATLSMVWIQSPYLEGRIYGVRLNRDIIRGKCFGELELRQVSYQYTYTETPLRQTIAGARFSWRWNKKLSMSINYEGEIQQQQIDHRVYTYVTQRF